MENISHALPKRSFASNPNGGFTSHKSVYDDVFGGPPKFGLPTLAPRLEDYTEIFGGFHASRSSSIPLLDIPLIRDDSELHFDARSPGFNYAEVFGDCRGLDWTVSFEDVVGQSSGGYDSSDEPWSPAKSGSLSDELDPLAESDKSYRWSDDEVSHRSLQNKRQLNVSYNRSGQRTMETVLAGASHVTTFGSHHEVHFSSNGKDEHRTMHVTDNVQHKKCLSNSDPLESGCYMHENNYNPLEKHGSDTSSFERPFMTITDINLRTKPSRVPPPSRPPPALAVKKRSNSKLKASKSYAFERVADSTTPLFLDVEVDGTVYVDGMKDVHMKNAWTKGSLERVDTWDDSKWHLEDVMKEEEKKKKTFDSYSSFQGDKMLQSHGKETTIKGPVAWREEKEYFEVIEKDISMEPFDPVEHSNVSMQFQKPEASRSPMKTESEASDENENGKKFKVTKEASRWDGKRNQLEMANEDYDGGNKHQRERTEIMLSDKKEFREKMILEKLAPVYDVNTIMSDHDQDGESGKLQIDLDETKANFKQNGSFEIEKRYTDAQTTKNSIVKPKKDIMRKEYQRRLENMGQEEITERVKARIDLEGTENQQSRAYRKENENKLEESHMPKENERIVKDSNKHGESGESCIAVVHDRKVNEQITFVVDKDKEIIMEVGTDKLNGLTFSRAFEQAGNDEEQDAIVREDNDLAVEKAEIGQDMYLSGDAGMVQPSEESKESEPIEMNRNDRPVKWDSEINVPIVGQETVLCVGDVELKIQPNFSANESESGLVDPPLEGKFNKFSKNKGELRQGNTCFETNNTAESLPVPEQLKDSNTGHIVGKTTCAMPEKIASSMCYSNEIDKNISTEDKQDQTMKRTQVIVEEVTPCQAVNASKVEDTSPVSECNKDQQYSCKNLLNQSVERKDKNQQHSSKNVSNQSIVRKDKNTKENLVAKDQNVGDRIRRDIELENERLRRIEEEREREREREREKDRMAVDKAAFEACERSHVEAREKAERAAVERATTEVRQRAMAVSRERLEKASMEARQRAERAAVERATAEARQRAIERSTAEKTAFERSIYDRFSVPSRSADTKQSFVSSNIQFRDKGISSGLRHSIFPADVGAEGESPQRCKARLERYRRTAERSANALAEKNMRDLLAQKEREERNRVAETLDAEVKRWLSGKDGNLRALLSTLQYILGPNSGWQPVPLTEVITSAAVKKAYRKATLCVHPDKLQQRGATIHQKYICEKVFDLLKEAWNKFNSEER